jgi:hypothetical protein
MLNGRGAQAPWVPTDCSHRPIFDESRRYSTHLRFASIEPRNLKLPFKIEPMSFFLRNLLHAVPAGGRAISSVGFQTGVYKRNGNISKYIEYLVMKDCRKPGGLDSQGAVRAEMLYVLPAMLAHALYLSRISRGSCHHGGTDSKEPFHGNFVFFDATNNPIPTRCPKTGKKTNVHHLYLAKDANDLESSANTWASV